MTAVTEMTDDSALFGGEFSVPVQSEDPADTLICVRTER